MNQELTAQVRRITEKVLKERAQTAAQNRKVLAIFGTTQNGWDIPLQQLQQCQQDGWKIQIILSELATKTLIFSPVRAAFGEENIWQENELRDIDEIVNTYPLIVLPALAYPMAAKLALRLVDTPCTYLVFEALRQEKRVIAASDAFGARAQFTSRESFGQLLETEYVNLLSELGVQWVTAARLAEAINEANTTTRITVETAVISASVIANLAPDIQELGYITPAIVTPLAREHAQKRGIKLIPKRKIEAGLTRFSRLSG